MSSRRGVRVDVLRELAMSLPGVTEVPHMERRAFRTPRKMFVTVPPDGETANLLFDAATQAAWCEEAPTAFAPVPGGWGRMGYTTVTLANVTLADLETAVAQAHELASQPVPKKKPTAAARKKPSAKKKR